MCVCYIYILYVVLYRSLSWKKNNACIISIDPNVWSHLLAWSGAFLFLIRMSESFRIIRNPTDVAHKILTKIWDFLMAFVRNNLKILTFWSGYICIWVLLDEFENWFSQIWACFLAYRFNVQAFLKFLNCSVVPFWFSSKFVSIQYHLEG